MFARNALLALVAALIVEGTTAKKVKAIRVEKCGEDEHIFHLNKLALHPYPVELPSNTTVSLDMELDHMVLGPFKIDLKVYRSLLMWVKIPCIDGAIGSCTFENVCQHPEGTDTQKKIEKVFGFPLQGCIIPKFKLSMTVNDIALPDVSDFLGFLAGGSYKIEASISNDEMKLACIRLFAEVD